jgi:GH15 family glucan-1,4-alpha-glucosidase
MFLSLMFIWMQLPLDYQDEVMRASVILKLSSWEETGGIISSMTTSIATSSESQSGSLRDLRHCDLRDANIIVRAMADLNVTSMMDGLRKFWINAKANHPEAQQHVYGIGLENRLVDKTVRLTQLFVKIRSNKILQIHRLAGYRGLSTVGVGTAEYRRRSIETPSLCILSFSKMFYDRRCSSITTDEFYTELESLGDKCLEQYRTSDGNLAADRQSIMGAQNELLGISPSGGLIAVVHNWAACTRLGFISNRLGKPERAQYWNHQADELRNSISKIFFNSSTNCFVLRLGETVVDSSLFQLWKYEFLPLNNDKMMSTLRCIETALVTEDGVKHSSSDKTLDYASTFAWIKIQSHLGNKDKARALFDKVLKTGRKTSMTLSEKWDPATGEMWGNFPSALAMASLIDCAMELGESWISAA